MEKETTDLLQRCRVLVHILSQESLKPMLDAVELAEVRCATKVIERIETLRQQEMKQWIDDTSFEELLRHLRTAPADDSLLQGVIDSYYNKVLEEKRKVNPKEAVAASKRIGWPS
jgi:hypothetical protein